MNDTDKKRLIDRLCIQIWNVALWNLFDWMLRSELH
jgi:hypothetical protein